ncbi:tRNA (guanosine(37)-N1)-methyltransferase TrmD [Sporanaerobium hydrogeniformans]|uniref:tRNA (Guanosine(37)-N1)-methyltransferase TrmD n=1 Tax=Sporanaerobium hydrogeniformans TaxID=3072179 RepID=A0AC61DE07_9FIRM|nr:tRNA (guanosine(37)-N1)-methyltransferase TrmD [Sporanaerobium hydrogeniformans]PHV71120.1 tRNA (guanosine(37)-N1)-methyltransferase TrmD [Sporanaerobium hydrogeniformans]
MKITIMTLFKDVVEQMLNYSIMGRAQKNNEMEFEAVDIRDFAGNKHSQVDDYPYGGGAGMLMMAPPIYNCFEHIQMTNTCKPSRVVYVTPKGRTWNQQMAQEFSKEEHIVILCGHYEGIDQRVLDEIVTDEVSIGDYVLTGGELAALVMVDSIVRLVPGVLGKQESFEEESFNEGLLEHPHYTRPAVFRGKVVPEILLSGNHKKIEAYRREQSLIETYHKRPDLLEKAPLTEKDKAFLQDYAKKVAK